MARKAQRKEKRDLTLIWALLAIGVGLLLIVGSLVWARQRLVENINSFQACKDAGGSIAESYPEQCFIEGKSFTNPDQFAQSPDANGYIGMSETEAMLRAQQSKTPARVVEREGEPLPVTMDFTEGRLNFYIKDLRVYKVDVERTTD